MSTFIISLFLLWLALASVTISKEKVLVAIVSVLVRLRKKCIRLIANNI